MKLKEDRRSPTVSRVSHTALVDICSLEEEGSPFQGQSCNISGRGMHVRGSYLPEIGEQLVCRFNHEEHEVLVEGRVAWRSEGLDSGEFGIQFTALDADSADLLRTIGDRAAPNAASLSSLAPGARLDDDADEGDEENMVLESGERVRLHIDGLGAPMKANVMDGGARRVRVGSTLDFLKMGRNVQLEALVDGQRRGAQVDSVNVIINPTTSVPELVVQLRYEGISPTPPPARVKAETAGAEFSEYEDTDEEETALGFEDGEQEPWQPAAEVLRERLGGAMKSANAAAQQATSMLSSFASMASTSVKARLQSRGDKSDAPQRASAKASEGAKRRVQTSRRPARTAPSHLRSGIHDLNLARGPQRSSNRPTERTSLRPGSLSGTAQSVAPEAAPARRKWGGAIIAASAFVLFGGSALILRSVGDDAETPAVAATTEVSESASEASAPSAVAAAAKTQPAAVQGSEDEGDIVAEVPLFGTQAVASLSKAAPAEQADDAEAEKRAAAAAVDDQTWEDSAEVAEPASAEPWGRGRLYLPTIHRIRLDQAGSALSGAVMTDGFTVVVPGRKVMESGKSIQKRDKRIVAVKADNDGPNAKIRFEFRGPVPAYRVRLRQDFVEFLISAPEESVATL